MIRPGSRVRVGAGRTVYVVEEIRASPWTGRRFADLSSTSTGLYRHERLDRLTPEGSTR